uniref:syntaxin-8 isoform X6 n=1 Tax=Halichoerus grypus TaxID=9711 RepID=UPI0016596AB5|nr:syntaxin-8 isoform X6 [Halichoerus grypus]
MSRAGRRSQLPRAGSVRRRAETARWPRTPGSPRTILPARLRKRLPRKSNSKISMKEMVKIQSGSSLMPGGAKQGVPNPWLFEEPEEIRGLGFDEIRQHQQKIIQEQDAGLDALSSIISRQKQMGKEIGNELDEQNEIIDDLANLVENTDGKLRTETRRVNMVDRKSTSCERHSERGNTSRGSGRGRSRLPAAQGAGCGARSRDPGIMT